MTTGKKYFGISHHVDQILKPAAFLVVIIPKRNYNRHSKSQECLSQGTS